jgi:hypothetical protein
MHINLTRRFGLAVVVLGLVVGAAGQSKADVVINVLAGSSTADMNGAIYAQTDNQPAGSGYIDAFLRTQMKGMEQGYNTDGVLQFDTKPDGHTNALLVTQVPVVTIGGIDYREFLLDINESQGGLKNLLSMDRVEIYLTGDRTITNFDPNAPGAGFGSRANLVYSLDGGANGNGTVELDSDIVRGGSGQADMYLYVKNDLFKAAYNGSNNYVVLYNHFGTPHTSESGYEEWAVRATAVPEPSTLASAGTGVLMVLGYAWRRRRRAAA